MTSLCVQFGIQNVRGFTPGALLYNECSLYQETTVSSQEIFLKVCSALRHFLSLTSLNAIRFTNSILINQERLLLFVWNNKIQFLPGNSESAFDCVFYLIIYTFK